MKTEPVLSFMLQAGMPQIASEIHSCRVLAVDPMSDTSILRNIYLAASIREIILSELFLSREPDEPAYLDQAVLHLLGVDNPILASCLTYMSGMGNDRWQACINHVTKEDGYQLTVAHSSPVAVMNNLVAPDKEPMLLGTFANKRRIIVLDNPMLLDITRFVSFMLHEPSFYMGVISMPMEWVSINRASGYWDTGLGFDMHTLGEILKGGGWQIHNDSGWPQNAEPIVNTVNDLWEDLNHHLDSIGSTQEERAHLEQASIILGKTSKDKRLQPRLQVYTRPHRPES